MAQRLPVPDGTVLSPSRLVWTVNGVRRNPQASSAAAALSISGTKNAVWSRKTSSEPGSCFAITKPSSIEHRQPNCRRTGVGPLDAAAAMRGDVDPVAGAKRHDIAVGKTEPGCAGQHHYEFGLVLVVPEPGRAHLATRDNALNPHGSARDQTLDDLAGAGAGVGQITQQVHRRPASVASTARRQPAQRSSRSS